MEWLGIFAGRSCADHVARNVNSLRNVFNLELQAEQTFEDLFWAIEAVPSACVSRIQIVYYTAELLSRLRRDTNISTTRSLHDIASQLSHSRTATKYTSDAVQTESSSRINYQILNCATSASPL